MEPEVKVITERWTGIDDAIRRDIRRGTFDFEAHCALLAATHGAPLRRSSEQVPNR